MGHKSYIKYLERELSRAQRRLAKKHFELEGWQDSILFKLWKVVHRWD